MIAIIKSLGDTYKAENKKLKLRCELYETYINALEKQRAELKEKNTAYKILLRKQLEGEIK